MPSGTYVVDVFGSVEGGGNPAPVVIDASGMTDLEMQQVAASHGHESAFVLPPPPGSDCALALRFWVPRHEMSMCGHATVGAVWLLHHLGLLSEPVVSVSTESGIVRARSSHDGEGTRVTEISQPRGRVEPVPDELVREIYDVLGVEPDQRADLPVQNAATSRVKTLVPVDGVEVLDRLEPDFERIADLCDRAGSTGLYPWAVADRDAQVFDARQFPQASGYPEDAATGIAAAALAFGLLEHGLVTPDRRIRIRQGRAMGSPSEIRVELEPGPDGCCWLGGAVRLSSGPDVG
jgi:PhzF family phenazine biosynthesis protein